MKPADRRFYLGCGMLIVAVLFAAWGFQKKDLSPDQRQILRWCLSLGAGFFAAAFVGKMGMEWKGLVPGLAFAASGGAAVWALTFFFLFKAEVITKVLEVKPAPLPERIGIAFNQIFSLKGTNIYGGLVIGGQLLDRSADGLSKLGEVGQQFGLRITDVFSADPLADKIIDDVCASKPSIRRAKSARDLVSNSHVDAVFFLALPNREIKDPISGVSPSEEPLRFMRGASVSTSDFLDIMTSIRGMHTYIFGDSDTWKPGQASKNMATKLMRVDWVGNPDASDLPAFFKLVLKGIKPDRTGPISER